jgi:hypothetical protein
MEKSVSAAERVNFTLNYSARFAHSTPPVGARSLLFASLMDEESAQRGALRTGSVARVAFRRDASS